MVPCMAPCMANISTSTIARALVLTRITILGTLCTVIDKIDFFRISITIVSVFVTCHFPRFIPNVIEMAVDEPPEVSLKSLGISVL
jgi:hypothetical protein